MLSLAGEWIVSAGHQLEAAGASLLSLAKDAKSVIFDLAGLQRMDTAGAWFIDRAEVELAAAGATVSYRGEQPKHDLLLKEAGYHPPEKSTRIHPAAHRRAALGGRRDDLRIRASISSTLSIISAKSW